MAARPPALCLLLMVGMWASCRHRGVALGLAEPALRLSGGGCRCAGLLEVHVWSRWSPVCWDGVSQDGVCRRLGCGPPTKLSFVPPDLEELQAWAMQCEGTERCRWVPANCSQHATIACSEPEPTSTEPPPVPPTTSPEPTGAPWLRLVDGNFSCSGFVELHLRGRWGAVALGPDTSLELPTRICHVLGCSSPDGVPIGGLISGRMGGPISLPPQSHLPVRWEAVVPCTSPELLNCFNWTGRGQRKEPTFLICPGSQPRARRRLAGGPTPCEGHIEVFQRGLWHVLCDEQERRAERGRQLCRELRCGDLSSSAELRDPHAGGVICRERHLHLCPESLEGVRACSRTRVVCQDSKPPPAGTAPGTVASICLALLLLGVLLLVCGPPAYRRLMKRISKKKQRQWIGPTGLHQSVSFHRNSTITPRARAEEQRARGGDNDYTQPPQKSLSTYPALEGTARASSALDNSSDSDYDLHAARRL
ncbi:T-cell surface glycoprotein CD5 isoform X2 [Cyrtonyx montezumae]|uniref:T-cell surface glycoprotein CD5 isoform X2 n=1 Tax=Cyrtonyx montezumae TaxID=9017 RepID=UPI0032DB3544